MSWDPDAFFTLHSDLPREGPGLPEDVHWALSVAGVSGSVSVCDAGCGPGADLETLAAALPQARLIGIETHPPFIDAARSRVARFGDRVTADVGDMSQLTGPFDLIWSAGALYFLGVQTGLRAWAKALAPGGYVAFSEPVAVTWPLSASTAAFWEEYSALTDLPGLVAQVEAAGFEVMDHRLITGAAWAAYYDPMRHRVAALRKSAVDDALARVLDEADREIALWEEGGDDIAYALLVTRPA